MPRQIQIRRSPLHGKDVFAVVDIPRGKRIIEYKGAPASLTPQRSGNTRPNPDDFFHTFLFALSDGRHCIDAGTDENAARWINHRCAPNCEAVEEFDRNGLLCVYLHAKRLIRAGEELNFGYCLGFDQPATDEDRRNYLCRCRSWELSSHNARPGGESRCRGPWQSSAMNEIIKPESARRTAIIAYVEAFDTLLREPIPLPEISGLPPTPRPVDQTQPLALLVSAHPDDECLTAGAALH